MLDIVYVTRTQILNSSEPLVLGTRTSNSCLNFLKTLGYTKKNKMLLERRVHIEAKVRVTATCSDEDQIPVCFVIRMDYSFAHT